MADNRQYMALEWVIGEIKETLLQAQKALELYARDPGDAPQLKFCLTYIHQVYGSLHMVGFHGAAMIASEMEALTQELLDDKILHRNEANEVLMRAILQLPDYLEQTLQVKRDQPNLIFSLLNDLRAVRGESFLSESTLFSPNLTHAYTVARHAHPLTQDSEQLKVVITKLRTMYQYAAASVIHRNNTRENLSYLLKVSQRLEKILHGTKRFALWEVVTAFVSGLQNDLIPANASIKSLLRQLDDELQLLEDRGVSALSGWSNEELLKNLLYYLSSTDGTTPAIDKVRAHYELDQLISLAPSEADQSSLRLADPSAMQSVANAILEEFAEVKVKLDACQYDDNLNQHFDFIQNSLQRVTDTLALLGVEHLRQESLKNIAFIEELKAKDAEPSNEELLNIAQSIASIETELENSLMLSQSVEGSSSYHFDSAQSAVLQESRNGLEQAKDAVVTYIATQWDIKNLYSVPELLRTVSGSLSILSLPIPADLLAAGAVYVESQLINQKVTPTWQQLDSLADVIASIDYYLEVMSITKESDMDILEGAEKGLINLGVSAATVRKITQAQLEEESGETVDEVSSQEPFASEDSLLVESNAVPIVADTVEDYVEEPIADVEPDGLLDTIDRAPSLDEPVSTEIFIDDPVIEPPVVEPPVVEPPIIEEWVTETPVTEDTAIEQLVVEEPVIEAPEDSVIHKPDEDLSDDIDQEVIDIFVEEAAEVQETIAEYFPRWANNFDDSEALIEFRRSFHTLKGSGRIVKANEVGELAWSIENMLNRVLDKTIESSSIQVNLINKVLLILPGMVAAFYERQENPHHVECSEYMEWANQISSNQHSEAMLSALGDANLSELESNSDAPAEDIDEQLWEIFTAEAKTHLAVVREYIGTMDAVRPFYEPPTDSMQRAMHTLKGSAHMAELTPIAELVTPMERFAKDLRGYQVAIDDDILQLIKDCVTYTEGALEQIAQLTYPSIAKLEQFLARVAELRERSVGHLIVHDDEKKAPEVDPAVLEMFMTNGMDLLLDIDPLIRQWKVAGASANDWLPVADELAILQHGAERANLGSMYELSDILGERYKELIEAYRLPDDHFYDVLLEGHNTLLDIIDAIAAGQDLPAVSPDLLQRLNALADLQQVSEAVVFGETAQEASSAPMSSPMPSSMSALAPEITEEASEDTPLEGIVVESVSSADDVFTEDSLPEEPASEEELLEESLSEEIDSNEDKDLDQLLEGLGEQEELTEVLDADSTITDEVERASESELNDDAAVLEELFPGEVQELEHQEHHEHDTLQEVLSVPDVSNDDDDIDDEIIEIFLDEAGELIEELDQVIQDWEGGSDEQDSNEAIQRLLHTFKGGARLAGLMDLGELAHNFEAHLIGQRKGEYSETIIEDVHVYQDRLINSVDEVRSSIGLSGLELPEEPVADDAEVGEDKLPSDEKEVPVESEESSPKEQASEAPAPEARDSEITAEDNVLPFSAKTSLVPGASPSTEAAASIIEANPANTTANAAVSRRAAPQEMVKVSADLMEELVNLAGETSISRGRMEEQISELGYSIQEMDATVERLQEQLRRLDIETEAQVIFRQEQMADREDFDPLEMDRYSQLQQLSRSLIESASDLVDLKSTLSDKARDAETVLLQQSRINTELQEGLMRSRMVPFSRIVPRLRRIVRQISTELNKEVHFEFGNTEGELDRSMMERMVAPLEHMLRNAVDHGIEDAHTREQRNKPATGRVVLSLGREGSDVIIHLADDGGGIDIERVRNKAIENHLMNPDAELSDQEILQFILHAGFSTADTVTHISGRGVGMDVVNSEIKQLGGRVSIESRAGEGTSFTVRLPFTVSVNRALMINMGDDGYAIPLNTIEGIVRISPFELEHYYNNPDSHFEYAGEQYELKYLGTLLDRNVPPKLDGHLLPVPVLLVRSADHSVALQVDSLQGSREIVVKTLGAQFSNVQGLSGATILGDGHVVVILDLHAMIRQQYALSYDMTYIASTEPVVQSAIPDTPLVLVVDDSVTVRKVTTRLLEREGYEVITAKDGVDAMSTLQDHMPSVMLLDIEMPRMDGFEVAKNVRSSSRLNQLPIIMITSRTGEKHRQRGLELGANMYMGKPYQEDELLDNIRQLIGSESLVDS